MKKIKLVSVICAIFSMFIFLSGCSSVSYSVVQFKNGEILQSFNINTNKDFLTEQGLSEVSIESFKNSCKQVMLDAINLLYESFVQQTNVDYAQDEALKISILTKVDAGLTRGAVIEEDKVIAQLKFNNYETYKYFYGIKENASQETNSNKDTFLYKVNYTKTTTNFNKYQNNPIYVNAVNDIKDLVATYNIKNDNGELFSEKDLAFVYCYGVPSNAKLHSNADYVFTKSDETFHIWQMSSSNINREVELYTLTPKVVVWYVMALILTALLLFIIFIVVKIKDVRSKNNKKNVELSLNNIDFKENSDIITK